MASQQEQLATLMSSRYAETLKLWSQQTRDPLEGLIEETHEQGAEGLSDDYIGHAVMRKIETRDAELPTDTIGTDRRWLYFDDYHHDAYVSQKDEIRLKTMTQARSKFAEAQAAAAARLRMYVAISGLLGTVYTGKNGSTPVDLPNGQTIVHGSAGFSLPKFDTAVQMLKTRGQLDPNMGDRAVLLWNAKAEKSFINTLEVASRDYSNSMVREKGYLPSWGLVDFVMIEDLYDKAGTLVERYLPYEAGSPNVRTLIMFVKKKALTRWRPDHTQGVVTWDQRRRSYLVSTDESVGARRNHEFQVVPIQVTETADT